MGADYSIADISLLGWVRNLIGFYEARELVGFDRFLHVKAWLDRGLARPAVQRGLQVIQAGVDGLILETGRVSGVVAGGEAYRAEGVAIAGGAWSATFGPQLGLSIPVEPQRGQLIHLKLPGTDTSHWPIVLGFRGHYLVPWPGGRVVAVPLADEVRPLRVVVATLQSMRMNRRAQAFADRCRAVVAPGG